MSAILHVSIDEISGKHDTYWKPLWSEWSRCTTMCGNTTRTLRCFSSAYIGGHKIKCTRTMPCSEQCGGE